MHYKNGREAKVGDKVVGRDLAGNPIAGVVVSLARGATCNIGVVPVPSQSPTYTSAEFLHVDDALPQPVPIQS